ncbi:MAG: GNAT family N-acetyltransferase [Candidatus Faecousia sp.]|nr:GNAT family N-acetyltransferase [Candidatus Faecousia sp.]
MALVTTERLEIVPLSDGQMLALIAGESDPETKQAYTEMRELALAHRENRLWYTAWQMRLRENREAVGDLCFKGLSPEGVVEIGYGMNPAYEGRGFMTEAVKAMVLWASRQPGVREIQAGTEPGNRASQRVLEKAGFRPNGITGAEGPRFTWIK